MTERLRRVLCRLLSGNTCNQSSWCYSPSKCFSRVASEAWGAGTKELLRDE